jgi:hypothetical protein
VGPVESETAEDTEHVRIETGVGLSPQAVGVAEML